MQLVDNWLAGCALEWRVAKFFTPAPVLLFLETPIPIMLRHFTRHSASKKSQTKTDRNKEL